MVYYWPHIVYYILSHLYITYIMSRIFYMCLADTNIILDCYIIFSFYTHTFYALGISPCSMLWLLLFILMRRFILSERNQYILHACIIFNVIVDILQCTLQTMVLRQHRRASQFLKYMCVVCLWSNPETIYTLSMWDTSLNTEQHKYLILLGFCTVSFATSKTTWISDL